MNYLKKGQPRKQRKKLFPKFFQAFEEAEKF